MFNDMLEKYRTKHPYEEFVDMIDRENIILSRVHKEWQGGRADNMTTIIRDVARQRDFKMPTRDLYEAHLSLSANEIQVAALVPFVGKDNASAASALLYNIVGQGQAINAFRREINNAIENGSLEELKRRLLGNQGNAD